MKQPERITVQRNTVAHVLEKFAIRFFTLLLLVSCFLLFYFGPQIAPAYKDVFISFSTSLFASLIFALCYSFLVERHHQAAVNEELSQHIKRAVEEIQQAEQLHSQQMMNHILAKIEEVEKSHYHEIALHFRELIPSQSFPPTDKPGQTFNHLLADELLRSRTYFFKGVTGRYIASRLAVACRQNLTCKVLLTDPTQKEALHLYVKNRFGITLSSSATEERVEQVRREIFMTIVDLFDIARWISPIELRMYRGPVFYRTELLDGFLMISYFTSHPTAYPTTYLYEKESFYYKTYLTDFQQTFELAERSLVLQPKTTEQDLKAFLTTIGCDLALIPQLQQEAEQFRQTFLQQVGWQIVP